MPAERSGPSRRGDADREVDDGVLPFPACHRAAAAIVHDAYTRSAGAEFECARAYVPNVGSLTDRTVPERDSCGAPEERIRPSKSGPQTMQTLELSPPTHDLPCAPSCARLCTADGFAQAYAALSGELVGYCRKALADHGLAEEITQDVFLRAWRHCSDFRTRDGEARSGVAQLRTWLFAIARNAVIDAVRGRGRRPALHPEPDQAVRIADPSDTFARFDTAEQVQRALAGLSPDGRAILTAIFIEELTYEQAAARLGIPIGTAKSRVYYALRALRAQIDDGPSRPSRRRPVRTPHPHRAH
jgi:RNA polymerase sigma-70 factor (ECF subfamily)